jgi:hypothetical protein
MVACTIMRGFLQRRISQLSTVAIAADARLTVGVDA